MVPARPVYPDLVSSSVPTPANLDSCGLVEVLDWTAGVLNRVDRAEFFSRFEDEHAVQYFYEPFLEAYDPELRRRLGVWYTPPGNRQVPGRPRGSGLCARNWTWPDGLADPNVIVLDPCCGTGAYIVEVLKRIGDYQRRQGRDAAGR